MSSLFHSGSFPSIAEGESLETTVVDPMLGFELLEFDDDNFKWDEAVVPDTTYGMMMMPTVQPMQHLLIEEEEEEMGFVAPTTMQQMQQMQQPFSTFSLSMENLPPPPLFPSFVEDALAEASLSSHPSSPVPLSASSESEGWGSSSDDGSSHPTSPSSTDYSSDGGFTFGSPLYADTLAFPKVETVSPALLQPVVAPATTKRACVPTKKEPAKRKRARKNPCDLDGTAVTLPRAKLLQLTSEELEAYVVKLRAARQLTPAEEKDIGRQRRLVKNRESASLSRQRRKEHLDELEQQVSELTAENVELRAQVDELQMENISLKERLDSGVSVKTESTLANAGASVLRTLQDWTSVNSKKSTLTKSAAAAGACLAIILFSFGLFFNSGFLATSMAPALQIAGPSVLPYTQAPNDFPQYRIRDILSRIDEEEEEITSAGRTGSAAYPISCDDGDICRSVKLKTAPKRNVPAVNQATKNVPAVTPAKQEEALTKALAHGIPTLPQFHCGEAPAIDDDSSHNPAATPAPPMPMSDDDALSSPTVDAQILAGLRASLKQQHDNTIFSFSTPNVTYLVCPQARPLTTSTTADSATNKVELDSMLTLLVSPSAIGYSPRDIAALTSGSWTPPPPASGVHTLMQVRALVTSVKPLCYSLNDAGMHRTAAPTAVASH